MRMPRVGDAADDVDPAPELVPTSLLESVEDDGEPDVPDPGLEEQPDDTSEDEPADEHDPDETGSHGRYPELVGAYAVASAAAEAADNSPTTSYEPAVGESHGRGRRRRGLGLIVTGGCAGIAVAGFLVLNGGGSGGQAAVGGTASHSAKPSAGSTASTLNFGTASFSASLTASASPSSTPSASHAPTHTTPAQAPSTQPAPTTSAPSSSKPSVPPSQSTSPTPTGTKTFCLLFC